MPYTPVPRADGTTVPAYVAVPVPTRDRPGPWPGVVVVHDILGLGDDIREQAEWFAAAGYLAVVPDLYSRGGAMRCVRGVFGQLKARQGSVFDEVEAAQRWVTGRADCTGRAGVVGYCLGGGFALLMAGREGWSVASVNYGQVPPDVDDVLSGSCPMVASYGGADRSLRGAAPRIEAALDRAGVPHDVKEYPGAGHAFINRIAAASPLTPVLRVAGAAYDGPAATDAKRRILAFFDEHLRGPGPG